MKYFTIIPRACAYKRNAALKRGRFSQFSGELVKRSDRRTTFGAVVFITIIRHESETFLHAIVTNAPLHRLKQLALDKSAFPVFPRIFSELFFLPDHFALREIEQNMNRCATWCADCTDKVTACAKYLSIHIFTSPLLYLSLSLFLSLPKHREAIHLSVPL